MNQLADAHRAVELHASESDSTLTRAASRARRIRQQQVTNGHKRAESPRVLLLTASCVDCFCRPYAASGITATAGS